MIHRLRADDPVVLVHEALAERLRGLPPPMLIGAEARRVLHESLGHAFPFTSTGDLDLTLRLPDWAAFARVTDGLPSIGDSGFRFRVAGLPVDIIPFGRLEERKGTLVPPWRPSDPVDVFGRLTVYEAADWIGSESNSRLLRIPTVPGYTALKLKAWIDRHAHDTRDAPDLALVLYWAMHRTENALLYDTRPDLLVASDFDLSEAGIRFLGVEVAQLVGRASSELLAEGIRLTEDLLSRRMINNYSRYILGLDDLPRRVVLLRALGDGLR